MSFSSELKEELSKVSTKNDNNAKLAELSRIFDYQLCNCKS